MDLLPAELVPPSAYILYIPIPTGSVLSVCLSVCLSIFISVVISVSYQLVFDKSRWKVLHVSLPIVSCVAYLLEHDSEIQLNTKHT